MSPRSRSQRTTDRCPVCQSTDIESEHDLRIEQTEGNSIATQESKCLNCWSVWIDRYVYRWCTLTHRRGEQVVTAPGFASGRFRPRVQRAGARARRRSAPR